MARKKKTPSKPTRWRVAIERTRRVDEVANVVVTAGSAKEARAKVEERLEFLAFDNDWDELESHTETLAVATVEPLEDEG